MGRIKMNRDISLSVLVKSFVLILNFAIVWLSARLWGAEGKGAIAIFIANLGMIAIVGNIFTSSSVSYFLSRTKLSKLTTNAYIWVVLVSMIATLLFAGYNVSKTLTIPLFVISTLLGLIAFHSAVFIGDQQIFNYNLIAFLQPLLLLIGILVLYFIAPSLGYYSYFYAQLISLFILLIISVVIRRRRFDKVAFDFDTKVIKDSFHFGWQVELSSLLQFLNYRFSMYALERLSDLGKVGIFSIGVQVMEAIWIFSKSISLVQYSNVLKLGDTLKARKTTEKMSFVSFMISIFCILIAVSLPEYVYTYIFGADFVGLKKVILILSPGTLAIAVSNVFGNYFSAIGKLDVLIYKSAIGLFFTVVLALLLIPKFNIIGAATVNTVSYIVSSLVIMIVYLVHRKKTGLCQRS